MREGLLRIVKRMCRALQSKSAHLIPISAAISTVATQLDRLEARLMQGVPPESVASDLKMIADYLRSIS